MRPVRRRKEKRFGRSGLRRWTQKKNSKETEEEKEKEKERRYRGHCHVFFLSFWGGKELVLLQRHDGIQRGFGKVLKKNCSHVCGSRVVDYPGVIVGSLDRDILTES